MLSATKSPPETWSERALQQLRVLADRPVFLVLLLLAANAVTRPYANITHDSRLYSVQVLKHAEPGAYESDIYFRYGSQDQYTLFSRLMAPLVRLIGLDTAFFLAYLASVTLFIVGLVWLLGRLMDDGLLRLVSLIYLAIAPLNYGGLRAFHVHEPFTTPRLLAVGLVLMGLAMILPACGLAPASGLAPACGLADNKTPRARSTSPWGLAYLLSLTFMILAAAVHPLMATGGVLVWAGVLLVDKLGWKLAATATVLVTVTGAAFLAFLPSQAGRVLGVMDEEWREAVLNASAFNFTAEWEEFDWANIVFSGVGIVAGVALFWKQDGGKVRFLAVAGLVGVAAVAGTVLAEQLPYALLLQGQPYRALWILKVLQVPLCFLLADRLLRSERLPTQMLGFVPLVFLLSSGPASEWTVEGRLPLFFFPGAVVAIRGLDSKPRRPDWLVRSVAWSLLLGELAWCLYCEKLFVSGWDILSQFQDTFELIRRLLMNVGVVPWMLLILGLLNVAASFLTCHAPHRQVGKLTATCLGIFLAVQISFFILPNTRYMREHGTHTLPDIVFARDFLRQQPTPSKMSTVYSSFGRVDYVWLELGTNSYYDWWQTGGFIFRRQTAIEGQRRALLVGPFEIERFREMERFVNERTKRNVEEFYRLTFSAPAPTIEDLKRLCQEPDLDYLVLKNDFPNLYSATNGRIYVYDCRYVRARLNLDR